MNDILTTRVSAIVGQYVTVDVSKASDIVIRSVPGSIWDTDTRNKVEAMKAEMLSLK